MSANNTVLISGYYGFDNFGDELILNCLSQALISWGYTPVALSQNPEETTKLHQIQAIKRTDIKAIVKALGVCKAFISGGGGLFQDTTSIKSPLYYGFLVNLAYQMSKPVAIWGQGIGPLNSWLGQWITVESFKKAQLILVRDDVSKTWVETHTGKIAYLMTDSVWGINSEKALASDDPCRTGLCISLRPDKRLTDEWLNQLAHKIIQLQWPLEEGVSMISAQDHEDCAVIEKFSHILKTHVPQIKITTITDNTACLDVLSQAKACIAMRLHAGIVALKHQTPTFAITYDPKVSKMVEMAEIKGVNPGEVIANITFTPPSSLSKLETNASGGYNHLKHWLDRI